ncbi:MAG: murein biosynthesis integral membrane protein MurJ [Actinomycetota bacterium]|nr:murein biosynthesis integral membrane protein MurJ [Actinomycetota bacterium]
MSDGTGQAEVEGVARSSAVMAVGTLVSRLLGFVRSVVLAAALGNALAASTYAVANTVPNIIYILLAGGVLNTVFVPQLVRAIKRGEGADGGAAYVDRLLTLSLCALLAITVVATLGAPLVVRVWSQGWHGVTLSTSVAFAYWCLPQILFYGIYTMLGQVLNARGVFGPFMWAPIVNNVVVIAVGLLFIAVADVDARSPGSLDRGEITLLGAGTTLGVVLQALVLVPSLRRAGYRFRPRFDWRGKGLGAAGRMATWTLAFVAVNQLAYVAVSRTGTAIDEAARDVVDYGVGYAAYSYAYLVFLLPHSIITVSVVTALLPRMSGAAAEGRVGDLRRDLSHGLRLVGTAIVPAAAAFLVLGPELLTVLYQWGEVSVEGARHMGRILAAFAPGLVAFSAHHLVLRAFYAQEDTRTPFFLTVPIAALNVVGVLVARAVLPLELQTIGMAAGYSLAYAVGLAISVVVLRRRLGSLDGSRVVRAYVRIALAAGVAATLAWAATRGLTAWLDTGLPGAVVAVVAGCVVLLVSYVVLARRMRVQELDALLAVVGARLGR